MGEAWPLCVCFSAGCSRRCLSRAWPSQCITLHTTAPHWTASQGLCDLPRRPQPIPSFASLHTPWPHGLAARSDEIYACSIFKPGGPPFVSAITLAQELVSPAAASPASGPSDGADDRTDGAATIGPEAAAAAEPAAGAAAGAAAAAEGGGSGAAAEGGGGSRDAGGNGGGRVRFTQKEVDTYVHLIYGLSKDWCASGLRVGLLYSRNQPLQLVGRAGREHLRGWEHWPGRLLGVLLQQAEALCAGCPAFLRCPAALLPAAAATAGQDLERLRMALVESHCGKKGGGRMCGAKIRAGRGPSFQCRGALGVAGKAGARAPC